MKAYIKAYIDLAEVTSWVLTSVLAQGMWLDVKLNCILAVDIPKMKSRIMRLGMRKARYLVMTQTHVEHCLAIGCTQDTDNNQQLFPCNCSWEAADFDLRISQDMLKSEPFTQQTTVSKQ